MQILGDLTRLYSIFKSLTQKQGERHLTDSRTVGVETTCSFEHYMSGEMLNEPPPSVQVTVVAFHCSPTFFALEMIRVWFCLQVFSPGRR